MPKCPVCDTQYDEVGVEDCPKYCHNCGWNLKLYLRNKPAEHFEQLLEKKPELLQDIEAWARTSWQKRNEQKEKLQETNINSVKLQELLNQVTKDRDELKIKLNGLEAQLKKDIYSPLTQENNDLMRTTQGVNLEQEIKKLKDEIKELSEKQNLNLTATNGELQYLRQKLGERFTSIEYITKLNEKLEQIETFLTANSTYRTQPQSSYQEQQILQPSPPTNSTEKPLTSEEHKLVSNYQHNKDKLSKTAIEVNVTSGTIDANRLGSQEVFLEKTIRGNYWIINWEGYKYLVPSKNIRLNSFNLRTIEALFECQAYQSGNSKDFQLLKPATVSELPEGETWKLVDRGILQFSS
jgi:uncharacterized coiled-coil DUF342 family protein